MAPVWASATLGDVREGTHDLRREGTVIAEQRTQAPGQAANPVTHGYARQHLLLQVDSGVHTIIVLIHRQLSPA